MLTNRKVAKVALKRLARVFQVLSLAAMVASCQEGFKHPDVSGIDLDIKVIPFYKDFFAPDSSAADKADRLSAKYGEYFDDYCTRELRLGRRDNIMFLGRLEEFLSYSENNDVVAAADTLWESLGGLEGRLTDAFKCLKHFLPAVEIPAVYCHISGFNSKLFVDSALVSFSIEHYFGSGCRFYDWLEIPVYARQTKTPDHIVPDVLKAWLYANYPDQSPTDNILANIVYQGKVLYVVWRCMPDLTEAELLGYTPDQLRWCKTNESRMWGYMAEQQLLYSTRPMDKSKLVNEAPFTAFFGQASPGRAALYCGLRIVMKYMERYPSTPFAALLADPDAQALMARSAYNPK